MASRYAVAAGNWNDTAVWSATDGGAPGASFPVDGDAVSLTATSGAITVTVNVSSAATSIDATGFTGTFTGSSALQLKGNCKAVAGCTWTYTGTLTSAIAAGTATLTSGGKTLCGALTQNGAGTLTFADAFVTTGTCTLTAGTWNDGNVNLTMAAWSSTVAAGCLMVFGSTNTWTISGSGTCYDDVFRASGNSAGNGCTIDFTYSGGSARTVRTGGGVFLPKVKVSAGSGTFLFDRVADVYSCPCNGLDFTGYSGTCTFNGTGAVNGAFDIYGGSLTLSPTATYVQSGGGVGYIRGGTLTSNGATLPGPINLLAPTLADALIVAGALTQGGTGGGSFNANNQNVTCSTFGSSYTTTRTITMGSGTWTLTSTAATTVWNMATTTGLTLNPGTATIDLTGVTASTRTITSNSVLMPKLKISAGSGAVTCTNGNYNGIEMTTGYTGTFANQTISFRGDVSLSSAATYTAGANAWTCVGTSGTCLFNSNGKTVDWPITVNGIGGTLQQAANLAMGATRTLTLTRGTFNSAGFTNNVTAVLMNGTAGTTTLTSGGSTWACALTVNGAGGTLTFGDSFTTTGSLTHTLGTITQSYYISVSALLATTSGTRVMNYAASSATYFDITGSGTILNVLGTGYTCNHTTLAAADPSLAGLATMRFTYSGSSSRLVTFDSANQAKPIPNMAVIAGSGLFTCGGSQPGVDALGVCCFNLDWTGFSGTYTSTASGISMTTLGAVAGNVTWSATMTITASAGGFHWGYSLAAWGAVLAGSYTWTSNGKVLPIGTSDTYAFTIAGTSGGTYTFADNFSTTGTINTYMSPWVAYFGGTLVTAANLTCVKFLNSNSTTRTITMGSGTWTLTSTAATTVWDMAVTTGLTLNANTATIDLTGVTTNVRTITANSVLLPTIKISGGTGAGSVTLTNVNCAGLTFANTYACTGFANQSVTIRGPVTLSNHASFALTAGANAWTLASTSGSNAFESNGKVCDFPITVNGVGGTHAFSSAFSHGITRTLTLTNGTVDFGSYTHTMGFFASSNANVRTIDTGTSTLQFPTIGAVWDTSTSTNLTLTGTGTIKLTDSSGTARSITAGSKRLPSLWVSAGTSTTTLTGVTGVIDLNMTGMGAGTIAAGAGAFAIGGSVTFVSAGTWSYTGALTFDATATGKAITSAGKAWTSGTVTFSGSGGGWTLQDAPVTFTSGNALTVAVGHLNTNDFAVTTPALVFSGAGVRELTLGASVVSLTGTGTIFDASGSNQTVNAGTSTLDCTDGTSTAKTFRTGGKVLNLIKVKKSTTNVFNFRDGGTMNLSLAA